MNGDDVDVDDADNNKSFKQFEIREAIVFLIEISPDLLHPLLELNNQCQLFEILASINDLLSELIMTMASTGVGVYFYNCQPVENSKLLKPCSNVSGFYKLFGLNYINMRNIKIINDIVVDHQQDVRKIDYLFKSTPPVEENLPIVLNSLIDDFQRKPMFNRKKLIWITNNDRPFSKTSTKEHLWRIINDYYNFGYYIRPIFLNNTENQFNMALYQDIFLNTNYMPKPEANDETTNSSPNQLFIKGVFKSSSIFKQTVLNNKIRSSIFRLKEVKRIQFACDLILSDGEGVGGNLGCSIKGYTLFSPEKVSRDFYLYTKDDNFKRVFVESDIVNTSSGEVLKIQDSDNSKSLSEKKEEMNIRKGYKLAGDEVLFLNQQQFQFLTNYAFDHDPVDSKTSGEEEFNLEEYDNEEAREEVTFTKPPYLKLIGFRSIDTFNPIYNSTAPIFVTPDLNDGLGNTSTLGGYENSFKTFSSLYQSCVKLGKYAVVFGCLKKNAKPASFILYPTRIQNSSKNESNDFPQGFLLISLPWLDDIRSLPNYFLNDDMNQFERGEDSKLTMGMVPYFKKLISQFFLGSYNPQDYPNPSLNYFYKIMKHELLQMELKDSDKSLTKNDITSLKLMELNQYIKDSEERSGLIRDINNRLEQLEQTLPKRSLPETTSSITKKQKVSYPELDENAVLTAWKHDDWSHFTVPQLKGFQSKYKDQIPSATKKQDIINNIKRFLDSSRKK